jgi:hypothetical protein
MGISLSVGLSEPKKTTCLGGRTEYVYLEKPTAPNPNPKAFKVLREVKINGRSILLVKYYGCTTFNGEKLILLKKIWNKKSELDPHFLNENHIVLARFEPNSTGWKLAKLCAKSL